MYKFSEASQKNLDTCDHHLKILFEQVITRRDCAVVCGHRGEVDQNAAFNSGKSKLKFPLSKHNTDPSEAVDVYPCVNGRIATDEDSCRVFGGFVMGMASAMGMSIRWGGDWDRDADVNDNTFNDLVHFETIARTK